MILTKKAIPWDLTTHVTGHNETKTRGTMLLDLGERMIEDVYDINNNQLCEARKFEQRTGVRLKKLLKRLGVSITEQSSASCIVTDKGYLWLGNYVIHRGNKFIGIVDENTYKARYSKL